MAGLITDAGERLISQTAFENLNDLVVHLAKNEFLKRNDQDLADFEEADYDGYLPLPLVFTGLLVGNPGGRAIATFNTVIFVCGGFTTPNQIFGFWIESPGGIILGVERYAGLARPMVGPTNQITIDVTIRLWHPS